MADKGRKGRKGRKPRKGRPRTCQIIYVNNEARKVCFDSKGRVRSNTRDGVRRKR